MVLTAPAAPGELYLSPFLYIHQSPKSAPPALSRYCLIQGERNRGWSPLIRSSAFSRPTLELNRHGRMQWARDKTSLARAGSPAQEG